MLHCTIHTPPSQTSYHSHRHRSCRTVHQSQAVVMLHCTPVTDIGHVALYTTVTDIVPQSQTSFMSHCTPQSQTSVMLHCTPQSQTSFTHTDIGHVALYTAVTDIGHIALYDTYTAVTDIIHVVLHYIYLSHFVSIYSSPDKVHRERSSRGKYLKRRWWCSGSWWVWVYIYTIVKYSVHVAHIQ